MLAKMILRVHQFHPAQLNDNSALKADWYQANCYFAFLCLL